MSSRNAQRLAPRVGVEKQSGAKAKKHVVWRKDRPEPYEEASCRIYIPAVYRLYVAISSLLITDSDFQPMPPERALEEGLAFAGFEAMAR